MAGVAQQIVELEEKGLNRRRPMVGASWQYGILDGNRIHEVSLEFEKEVGLVKASCLVKRGVGSTDWEVMTFETCI